MKMKRTIIALVTVIALTVACAALLFLSYRYEQRFASFKDAAYSVVEPVGKVIVRVRDFAVEKAEYFREKGTLIKENEQLKSELAEKSAQNTVLLQEKQDSDLWNNFDSIFPDFNRFHAKSMEEN